MPKFHPTYWSESVCKAESRHECFAKSAGTIFRFPFFNPVFKNTKIWYVFLTTRMNIPDNWTMMAYTFGPMKYRSNKSSAKLKIKL